MDGRYGVETGLLGLRSHWLLQLWCSFFQNMIGCHVTNKILNGKRVINNRYYNFSTVQRYCYDKNCFVAIHYATTYPTSLTTHKTILSYSPLVASKNYSAPYYHMLYYVQ